ncbi:MAG: peptidylprolyl isomerase [Planctomycetota bacterium]|jgi:cyclophilin family peptidyl-prolyl cis-trans isomerase
MLGIKTMSWPCLALIFVLSACDSKSESSKVDSSSSRPPEVTSASPDKPSVTKPPPAESTADKAISPAAQQGPARVAFDIGLGTESWGQIVLELDEEKAPVTVKNFLRYVDEGFYNGTIFHRVIPTFMIQGGGFVSATQEKRTGLHPSIVNESPKSLKNNHGTIAMARSNHPDSATSQFFINVKNNTGLDYPNSRGHGYCAFGKVIKGMDVVDRIKNVTTKPNPRMRGEKSLPINPPVLKKAYRVKAS